MSNEALFQSIANFTFCKLSPPRTQAQVVHHIVNRGQSKILRWDFLNAYPLLHKLHNNDIEKCNEDDIPNISDRQRKYLKDMKNMDYKDYLIKYGLSDKEFEKGKEKELKNCLNFLSSGGDFNKYINLFLNAKGF